MASRMDKYHKQKNDSTSSSGSRLSKNENLYEKLYTNKVFTEFTNTNFDNVIDLSEIANNNRINKREQFQKNRVLSENDFNSKKDSNFGINQSNEEVVDKREKNYNINDILENARKNRKEEDELEKKRRLKSVEYSILSDLSQEKLKEYRENKQNKLTKEEEENLEELIHTITSNSLRKRIDDELLSDLLPTEEYESIVSKELLEQVEEIDEKNQIIKEEIIQEKEEPIEKANEIQDKEEPKFDNSFYTKSMELSKQDFELEETEEDDYSFLEEKKMGIFPKIMFILLILGVIAIVAYVIYRFI